MRHETCVEFKRSLPYRHNLLYEWLVIKNKPWAKPTAPLSKNKWTSCIHLLPVLSAWSSLSLFRLFLDDCRFIISDLLFLDCFRLFLDFHEFLYSKVFFLVVGEKMHMADSGSILLSHKVPQILPGVTPWEQHQYLAIDSWVRSRNTLPKVIFLNDEH